MHFNTYLRVICSFFAACNGDTWSSELGVLSGSAPVMVTNPCKSAPAGTNGAISTMGTLASCAAGALVGCAWLAATVCMAALGPATSAAADSPWTLLAQQAWLLPAAATAGTVGSLLDSFLGATLQQSVLRLSNSVIVSSERARQLVAASKEPADGFKVIAGVDVLSNEGVNVVASSLTALLGVGALLVTA